MDNSVEQIPKTNIRVGVSLPGKWDICDGPREEWEEVELQEAQRIATDIKQNIKGVLNAKVMYDMPKGE